MILLAVALAVVGGGAAAAIVAASALREPSIDSRIMRAVERDPGYGATPPNAVGLSRGRRLVCTDPSGDPPQTFRTFSVPWPDDQVLAFYRTQLSSQGWVTSTSPPPISGASFSKTVAGSFIELDVYIWLDNDNVSISASTRC